MKIVFVSVALNIHQVGVADELCRLTDGQYWFVETDAPSSVSAKGGDTDFSQRPYLVKAYEDVASYDRALQLVRDADVLVSGSTPSHYLKERVKTGKLTFVYSERWLKRGWINVLSPRLIKFMSLYHKYCRKKPVYALCASGYAAGDYARMLSFRGKCFKWGYFTQCAELGGENMTRGNRDFDTIRILWCGRFVDWKHPESMVHLAQRLVEMRIDFRITMIGTGELLGQITKMVAGAHLWNYVNLVGSIPNRGVIEAMQTHSIFCATSDRNEGWGAVLNEAMGNGCCVVASKDAGSTPYLVQDGVNGRVFDLEKESDLFDKVYYCIKHPEARERMSRAAYETVSGLWSAESAAKRLLGLSEALLNGEGTPYQEGPCSIAEIL